MLCWSTFGRDYSLESSWLWRYKLGIPVFGEFLPFFSVDSLKLCQVGWECRCTAIFRSFQRCSIGFKSGLLLGHSRTFRDLSRSHSCMVLAVCLAMLSCWKVDLCPSLRSWVLWSRFSSNISLYFAPFTLTSILTSLPVPAAEKHPHSMMLPPPCFIVGMVPGFLQTGIQAKEFNLSFIRPENLVSHLVIDSILSRSATDNSFDLMSWILLWHALSTVGPYIDRRVSFQTMSIQFTTGVLQ